MQNLPTALYLPKHSYYSTDYTAASVDHKTAAGYGFLSKVATTLATTLFGCYMRHEKRRNERVAQWEILRSKRHQIFVVNFFRLFCRAKKTDSDKAYCSSLLIIMKQ